MNTPTIRFPRTTTPELVTLKHAAELSRPHGFTRLLGSSTKIAKSNTADADTLTAVVYLTPAGQGVSIDLCADATDECKMLCLGPNSGRGQFSTIQAIRAARTELYASNPQLFATILRAEIHAHVRRARAAGLVPALRINGATDIPVELCFSWLFELYPDLLCYDYTKSFTRMLRWLESSSSRRQHLTFSYLPSNRLESRRVLEAGGSVAVCFEGKTAADFPATFLGARVIDGDATDRRFEDPAGVVVGLTPKGSRAKHDTSGFVVRGA